MRFVRFLRMVCLLGGLGLLLALSSCSRLTSGLQVAGEVEGRVLDLRTGEPIAGAEVRSERAGKSAKTKSKRDGSFRLRPLLTYTKDPSLYDPLENHFVRVSAAGYEPASRVFRHPLDEGARPPAHRNLRIGLRRRGERPSANLPITVPALPNLPPDVGAGDVGTGVGLGQRQGSLIAPPPAGSFPRIPRS